MTLTPIEYRLIVDHSPVMIWRSDRTKPCDYFNRVWLEYTGRTMEQELGNGWAEGVHADDFERCLQIYTSSFDLRLPFEMEYRLKRNDGVYRWIFDRGVPFTDEVGQFMGYIGSCIDVHERVEAERASQEAARAELHALRGMLSICDGCKRIRTGEGRWEALESFMGTRYQADVSPAICPQCLGRAMPFNQR